MYLTKCINYVREVIKKVQEVKFEDVQHDVNYDANENNTPAYDVARSICGIDDRRRNLKRKYVERIDVFEPNNVPSKPCLTTDSYTYQLDRYDKNAMLIINERDIKCKESAEDIQQLSETFEQFRFQVDVIVNFNKDQILEAVQKYFSRDLSNYGCVAVIILIHRYNTVNDTLRYVDIEHDIIREMTYSNLPTLAGKPKIFITNTQKRDIRGFGVGVKGHTEVNVPEGSYSLPLEADLLSIRISKEQYNYPERYKTRFVQVLSSKLNDLGDCMDLESIMTEVKKEIAVDNQIDGNSGAIVKHMPTISSTLIRKLFLYKRNDTQANNC